MPNVPNVRTTSAIVSGCGVLIKCTSGRESLKRGAVILGRASGPKNDRRFRVIGTPSDGDTQDRFNSLWAS